MPEPPVSTNQLKVPAWCVQVAELPLWLGGNSGSNEFEGVTLATEVWGEAANAPNSGLLAFPYLWRRFGPPFHGNDDYKVLCEYIIATPHDDVWLSLSPRGSSLGLGVGYLASEERRDEIQRCLGRPYYQNWRVAPPPIRYLNEAVFVAMYELLRPVHVRDVAINILGRTDDPWKYPAEPSKYAGLGVSQKAMDRLLKD